MRQLIFKSGMVISVEPGCYILVDRLSQFPIDPKYNGIGVRIEDTVVVTENGFLNLTDGAPKTIEAIEALMARGLTF